MSDKNDSTVKIFVFHINITVNKQKEVVTDKACSGNFAEISWKMSLLALSVSMYHKQTNNTKQKISSDFTIQI